MKLYQNVPIAENRPVARDTFLLRLPLSELASFARPGQFVNLYFNNPVHLFPRPFSIAGFEDEHMLILYKRVGKMTSYLSTLPVGTHLTLLGPLGNSFTVDTNYPVLLAGGVGLAPLAFLRQILNQEGRPSTLILGARTAEDLPLFSAIGEPELVTEDGSRGMTGNVLDYFSQLYPNLPKPLTVYACGPEPMLRAIIQMAQSLSFQVQVSLERVMACGLGLCQGCAVKIKTDNATSGYKLVCKDGPVFNGMELSLND